VTAFILGLQHRIVLDEGTVGVCMGFSTGLMSSALDIGIEPMFYVTLDRRDLLEREDAQRAMTR
jgi:hypothetical protein